MDRQGLRQSTGVEMPRADTSGRPPESQVSKPPVPPAGPAGASDGDRVARDIREKALALAVEYTKKFKIFSGNSLPDGTVVVAKRYERYLKEGR